MLLGTGTVFLVFFAAGAFMRGDYLGWSPWDAARFVLYASIGTALIAMGWWPREIAASAALGVVGLAALVYSLASLSGGWLGTPPWQRRAVSRADVIAERPLEFLADPDATRYVRDPWRGLEASLALGAAGVVLLVVAMRAPPGE